jgi:hypothetical protein
MPAMLHKDAGMVAPLDTYLAVSVQPAMDVHAALGVMQGCDLSVRPPVH